MPKISPPPPKKKKKKKIGLQNLMAGRILETSGMAKEPNSGGKCSWVAVELDICWICKREDDVISAGSDELLVSSKLYGTIEVQLLVPSELYGTKRTCRSIMPYLYRKFWLRHIWRRMMNRFYTNLLLESVGSSLWKMFFPNYSNESIGEHKCKEFFVDPLMSARNK